MMLGRKLLRGVLSLFMVCQVFNTGFAYAEDYEEMDIMSLLGTNVVTVASKKEEDKYDAPGVITVISKKEIESYGADCIGDVLNKAPNAMFMQTDSFYKGSVGLRASENSPYNNRVLFLLNGRPVRESLTGSFAHLGVLSALPTTAVERIEIIRGPGSVLYGSSAFNGVINVITEVPDGDFKGNVSGAVKSQRGREGSFTAGSTFAEDGYVYVAGKQAKSSGQNKEFTDAAGNFGSRHYMEDTRSVVVDAAYKGLKLNYMANVARFRNPSGGTTAWTDTDWHDYTNHFFDLGYTFDLGDDSLLGFNLTTNQLYWGEQYAKSKDTLGEVTFKTEAIDKTSIVLGGVVNRKDYTSEGIATQWSNGAIILGNEVHEYSLYGQASYQLLETLKLIAGMQWNKAEGVDGNNSYRGGFIYRPTENLGLKVLYSEAFRTGFGHEMSYNIAVPVAPFLGIWGNSAIAPETIETTEAQVFYKNDKIDVALTVYENEVKKIIGRDFVTGYGMQYQNLGDHDFWGVELEGKYALTDYLVLEGSYIYQENKTGTDKNDPARWPNFMLKTGVRYTKGAIDLGIFNSHFGRPTRALGADYMANPKADEYDLLSANITVNINELTKSDSDLIWKVSFMGDNLLNEEIWYPDYKDYTGSVNTYPLRDNEPTYKVTFSVDF